ncbi:hypothetical protein [Levilactobacillus mulengensis]|uniref:hypothetical protein n=1 Tax=Levilactobacillus mulengensis TaxID=2486025 RepID=UPI000F7ACF26|nr:hypothetical protein [Levilactobacillus mulengensis]
MTESQKIEHLPYELDPQERDEVLRYLNMPGGDEILKRDLLKYSPDEVDARNLELLRQQMIHTKLIFPHH